VHYRKGISSHSQDFPHALHSLFFIVFLQHKPQFTMRDPRMTSRPRVLMLAAGNSARFGGDKRRHFVQGGKTLLYKSLEVYREADLRVLLCLSDRPEDDDLERLFAADAVDCLRCSRALSGMGATLAEGVSRCSADPGIFIALADMPLIDPGTILTLEKHLSADGIVYPVFKGSRGHPVLFGSAYFAELQSLDGDQGASALLRKHAAACHALAVDDPGVILDVDTREALAQAASGLKRREADAVFPREGE
jgi:molybdenum cofactor cytidylyltransferase